MTNTLIHPGEILREEFLIPLGISPYTLAQLLHVPRTRIERVVAEKSAITPDTALRLSRFFNITPEFWLNMQAHHDVERLRSRLQKELESIKQYSPA